LIHLIFPETIPKIIRYIIVIIQFIFLSQFIWEFIKIRITVSDIVRKILLFLDQTDINSKDVKSLKPEYYLLFLIYLFYFQYQIYNTTSYAESVKEDFDFEKCFEAKLANYPTLSKVIFNTLMMIKALYVWLIIFLFFYFITYFETSIFFGIKLIFFSLVVFKLLKIKTSLGITSLVWFLIIYSMIITTVVYFYQFTQSDLLNTWWTTNVIDVLPTYIKNKLELIGFKIFDNSDLPLRFLPHYGSNLMSVLLLHEVKRLIANYKNSLTIASKMDRDNKVKAIFNVYKKSGKSEHEHTDTDQSHRAPRQTITKTNQLEDKLRIIRKEFSSFQLYFLYSIQFLCNTYWLLLFLLLCASLIIYYQLSVYMLIYLLTSTISFMLIFAKFVSIAYPKRELVPGKKHFFCKLI